ncbi:hypothetical protein GUJ93_ZPchr0006g43367 [Zizania palustris]|uniref:Uncharacterized protein n=1 Tax=Zizania palustris TaxID=103762 RepID=A0A8J5W1A2_ZIZPA|nr:hypothetical protein GUJ93_ZPchr0006g43367 [Zizania palustris]
MEQRRTDGLQHGGGVGGGDGLAVAVGRNGRREAGGDSWWDQRWWGRRCGAAEGGMGARACARAGGGGKAHGRQLERTGKRERKQGN